MIEPRQIRAARALLNWSQADLAAASGIAVSSIKNIENSLTVARKDTIEDIKTALEKVGVEFIPESGVRIKNEMVHVFEGEGANKKLMDDVFTTLRNTKSTEILIYGVEEELSVKSLGKSLLESHVKKLNDAGVTEKILVKEGDTNYVNSLNSYRWIEEKYFCPFPIQLYGNKIALVSFVPEEKVIIIESQQLVEAFSKIFHFVWDRAQPVNN